MLKEKIYIAGKITGDPNYREKFETLHKLYEHRGFAVLNPAVLPEGMAPEDYMKICFAMIDVADTVVFLKDWRSSKGARLEYEYCAYTGKYVIEL